MASSESKKIGSLQVDSAFHAFVAKELLPATGLDADQFWTGVEAIIDDLTPVNRELLAKRDALQAKIDAWHKARSGQPLAHEEYVGFLRELGYLIDVGEDFKITTEGVDAEIATIAGPQLVVPVSNARFALNAANARWGSLYDALYGTDVISEDDGRERRGSYNPVRGAAVIAYAAEFLDRAVPLPSGSHADGNSDAYSDAPSYLGCNEKGSRKTYLFRNNNLHIEIQTDPEHMLGRDAPGNVSDVILESAITTIQDCEDSVAAVDAEDKVGVYRNWLGLMQGT
jgi:malate synthase